MFSFSNIYAKINMSHKTLIDDPHFVVAQSVAQQKIFRAEDHRSGLARLFGL